MLVKAKTSFSAMHSTLLSKLAPSTMRRAASGRSAVSSTMTGGLPGPAAMTFLPVFMATRTTASPPVMLKSGMSGWVMIAWPVSSVGSLTVVINAAGPPADTMASTIRRMASCEACLAAGWGLKTTALPAAIMLMELLMTVEVGLVDGVIEPMTPKGACSMSIMPLSPVSQRVCKSSMPGVRRLTSRFF